MTSLLYLLGGLFLVLALVGGGVAFATSRGDLAMALLVAFVAAGTAFLLLGLAAILEELKRLRDDVARRR